MQSFLFSLRRDHRKEIDVFRFSPSNLPASYRSRTIVVGFMREHQTSPRPDIDDFTRIDTNVGVGVSSYVVEDVSSSATMNFAHTWFITPPAFCRQCRNNGAFHMPPATKVFAVRPSVSSTYLTQVRFVFRHRYFRAKKCLNLIG